MSASVAAPRAASSGTVHASPLAYVAAASFILQNMNGCSPVAHAANAGGMTIAALVAAHLAALGSSDTALPMSALMIFGALLSLFGLLVLARPTVGTPGQ